MGAVIWLASYPKSGNTWFRIVLSNLLSNEDEPVCINNLRGSIACARNIFDDLVGIEASDLTETEIEQIRPDVYQHLSDKAEKQVFLKIHDAYTYIDTQTPLIPDQATLGAVYIIRNPLDIVVSYAHHRSQDYDTIIARMNDEEFTLCNDSERLNTQFPQKLLSWSRHVRSWTDICTSPVCIIRFEDMKINPWETFKKALCFSQLKFDTNQLQKALQFSSFEELQQQEKKGNFRERHIDSNMFFRKGEIGSWRGELNRSQVQRVIEKHGDVMKKFGYLDELYEFI